MEQNCRQTAFFLDCSISPENGRNRESLTSSIDYRVSHAYPVTNTVVREGSKSVNKALPQLGRVELAILRYVVEHHPITVREVAEHMAETTGAGEDHSAYVYGKASQERAADSEKIAGRQPVFPKSDKEGADEFAGVRFRGCCARRVCVAILWHI